jgi:hypothetical protein
MYHANYSHLTSLTGPRARGAGVDAQVDPVKEANPEPEPEQGKPRCITSNL